MLSGHRVRHGRAERGTRIPTGATLMRAMPMRSKLKRLLPILGGIVVVAFMAIQLLPFGRPQPNPPVQREPRWDSPRTREIAVRACFDCHSNQSQYPWYSHVAPVSWLVTHDIEEARSKVNFSEWDQIQREAGTAAEQVEKGEMPLWYYIPLHPEARLSAEDRQVLIDGLKATVAADRPRRR
jgi:hypothetical protein